MVSLKCCFSLRLKRSPPLLLLLYVAALAPLFISGGVLAETDQETYFAQDHNDKSGKSQSVRKSWKGKTIVPDPNIVFENSSEVLREKKRAYFHVAAGLIATEVAIGAYMTPDSIFDVRYLQQSDIIAGESMMISASYLRFVANSLFLRGAFVNRVGTIIDYLDSFAGNRGQKTSSDIGVDLAIGNRWQWEHLSIGAEWFSITLPFIGREYEDFDFQFRVLMMHAGVSF